MKINLTISSEAFWRWIALFAWRRWRSHFPGPGLIPDGVPGIRDVNNRCPIYEPRAVMTGDLTDCQGDGHYLCDECCHLDRDQRDETFSIQDLSPQLRPADMPART